ncbi:unnamed protein product [Nippostrongylus brasiliensis]|uniref:PDZ domain-containing protein n=1 Tax=Nippostrongylus brasiliensis TaxID=27835 RepID=A0A0N4Y998_NIPBR|nr:unnamed protein product [Nippostrongylus brasiliensis]
MHPSGHQQQPSSSSMCGPELISNVVYFNLANANIYENTDASHINKKTQYERPGPSTSTTTTMSMGLARYDMLPPTAATNHKTNGFLTNGHQSSPPHQPQSRHPSLTQLTQNGGSGVAAGGNPFFTRDPQKLRGEMVTTTIVKGPKGLGFTLIGNDASSKGNEFIQLGLIRRQSAEEESMSESASVNRKDDREEEMGEKDGEGTLLAFSILGLVNCAYHLLLFILRLRILACSTKSPTTMGEQRLESLFCRWTTNIHRPLAPRAGCDISPRPQQQYH